jgi:hypothetical protein
MIVLLVPTIAAAELPIPSQCQIDVGCGSPKKENGACPNDEAGQKDLTQFCVDPGENDPYDLHSKWNWDEVNGFSGGNTGDACTLYDTDGDGTAGFGDIDYAVCVTITDGDPPGTCSADGTTCNANNDCAGTNNKCILAEQDTGDSPRLFLCGDDAPDKCTQPIHQINQCRDANGNTPSQPDTCLTDADCTNASFPTCGLGVCLDGSGERTNAPCVVDGDCTGGTCDTTTFGPYSTQCEANITSDDPFDSTSYPSRGPGDAFPKDTEALCWIDLQDFNGQNARLIDACSYPSRQPNSDPSDCILFSVCTTNADCDDGNECTDDTCDTTSGSCRFTPKAEGTTCGDPSDTVCDNPDTCSAEGFCQDNFEPTTTECRASTDVCDPAEFCDGAGACDPDVIEPNGTSCDDGQFCTTPDTCTDGVCGGPARNCDDGLFCTGTEICDEVADACVSSGDPCSGAECNTCQEHPVRQPRHL